MKDLLERRFAVRQKDVDALTLDPALPDRSRGPLRDGPEMSTGFLIQVSQVSSVFLRHYHHVPFSDGT
jgi:hypothetical protein